MYEGENLLRIFEETKKAVLTGDSAKIKNLSDQTTNSASLTHDPDNIASAVIVYSLSKIIERENYRNLRGWNEFYKNYLNSIDKIILALKQNDENKFKNNVKSIIDSIENLSGELKKNIQDVFRKASINKASKIYEHGISMEVTAKLLGITLYELASYAGEREQFYKPELNTIDVKTRIKLAEEFFR